MHLSLDILCLYIFMEEIVDYQRLGDFGDLVNLLRLLGIRDIWEIFSFRRSVRTGIVDVLPGKF